MASNFKDQQTLYVASNEDSDTEPLESVAEDQQKQENNINDVSSPGSVLVKTHVTFILRGVNQGA